MAARRAADPFGPGDAVAVAATVGDATKRLRVDVVEGQARVEVPVGVEAVLEVPVMVAREVQRGRSVGDDVAVAVDPAAGADRGFVQVQHGGQVEPEPLAACGCIPSGVTCSWWVDPAGWQHDCLGTRGGELARPVQVVLVDGSEALRRSEHADANGRPAQVTNGAVADQQVVPGGRGEADDQGHQVVGALDRRW